MAVIAAMTAVSAALALNAPFEPLPDANEYDNPPLGVGPPTNPASRLYWVVEGADLAAYNGYTAVLVRGLEAVSATGGTANNSMVPTVTYEDGKWVLHNGYVHAIANLGESTEFVQATSKNISNISAINNLNEGDWQSLSQPPAYNDSSYIPVENDDRWKSAVVYTSDNKAQAPVQNSTTAYPYYMLIFDTSESEGMIDASGPDSFVGTFYELLNPGVPELQTIGNYKVLVVRFSGDFDVVPEPATAALFLLGVACLARRRRG